MLSMPVVRRNGNRVKWWLGNKPITRRRALELLQEQKVRSVEIRSDLNAIAYFLRGLQKPPTGNI